MDELTLPPVGWSLSLPHFRTTVVRWSLIGYSDSLIKTARLWLVAGLSTCQPQPIGRHLEEKQGTVVQALASLIVTAAKHKQEFGTVYFRVFR